MSVAQEMELWEKEYSHGKTIPSTTRRQASHALQMCWPLIQREHMKVALDAGCGAGRNSIYLAQKGLMVYSIDFSKSALAQLSQNAREAKVEENIRAIHRSLTEPLPVEDDRMDLVLDFYAFCGFTDENVKQSYLQELRRALSPRGSVLLSLFAADDEYYMQMPRVPSDQGFVVEDLHNGILTQLYTEGEIKSELANRFGINYFVLLDFKDTHMGKLYSRRIFTMALSK